MPAYALLKEIGCPSTLANHWRSMRHRLRRRLARQGISKGARGPRASKNAIAKGLMLPQTVSNGSSEPSLVSTGAGEGRKSSVSPRATGGNEFAGKGQNVEERKETKVAGRAEEDIGRVEDIDVGGERRVKRARTQEKLEGEQAASS